MPTVRCVTVGMQHDAETRIDEHSKATQPACACQTCLVHRLLGMPFRYTRGFLRHGTWPDNVPRRWEDVAIVRDLTVGTYLFICG